MDEDGKITDGEECEEPTAEPRPFNKDGLVLYHWTQSFASQKVQKKKKTMLENDGGFTLCSTFMYLLCFCVRACLCAVKEHDAAAAGERCSISFLPFQCGWNDAQNSADLINEQNFAFKSVAAARQCGPVRAGILNN